MLELLFLLLPVAAGYGWFMGRNSIKQKDHTATQNLSIKYSTGLNYLLSNQQDKAIDYLLEALKVEDDTVEAHFAMANLFRKRGELDRALKIHEHLVRHASLPSKEKQQAIFELAKDFMAAGLYDRAEKMFNKLLKTRKYGLLALQNLIKIYQSTKDWSHGIELQKAIVKSNDKKLLHNLANFYCEQASLLSHQRDFTEITELLRQALLFDEQCCRANVMLAEIYSAHQEYDVAAKCYQQIYYQDSEYFPDVIDKMHQCYQQLNDEDSFYQFIKQVYDESASSSALIKYVTMLEKQQSQTKAQEFMLLALKRRPTIKGFKHFVKMQANQDQQNHAQLDMIRELISAYLNIRPRYSCRHCGFDSGTHYWACPSCHEWEQLKPVRGLEGE